MAKGKKKPIFFIFKKMYFLETVLEHYRSLVGPKITPSSPKSPTDIKGKHQQAQPESHSDQK